MSQAKLQLRRGWVDAACLEEAQTAFNSSTEAESSACEVIHQILSDATQLVAANHLDRLAIPYTVQCVVKETLDFVRSAFVGQDDGLVTEFHWHADPQPKRVAVDPWARAAIEVLDRPHKTDATTMELFQKTQSGQAVSGSVSGLNRSSTRSKKKVIIPKTTPADAPRTDDRQASGAASSPLKSSPAATRTTKAAKKSVADRALSRASSVHSDSAGSGMNLTQEEIDFMEQAKQDATRREEARALQQQLTKQLDELKKDPFVVDGLTGKVIPVIPFEPPPAAGGGRRDLQRFTIGNPPPAIVAPDSLGPVKVPPGRLSGPYSAPPTIARRQQRRAPDASDFFVEDSKFGPMVDAVVPVGGVSVRDRDATLRSELKIPKNRMSRQEYQRVASVNINGIGVEDDDAQTSSVAPSAIISTTKQSSAAAATIVPTSKLHAATSVEYRPQRLAALPVAKKLTGTEPAGGGSSPRQRRIEQAKKLAAVSPIARSSSPLRINDTQAS